MADQSEKVAAAALAISAAGLLLYRRYASSSATPKASSALKAKIALYGQNAAADSDGSAWLDVLAKAANVPLDSQDFAAQMDAADPLRHIRSEFHIPPIDAADGGACAWSDGSSSSKSEPAEQAYFAGNSLGLLPKVTRAHVGAELDKWGARGVMGHFEGALPWATCEDQIPPLVADLVGAKEPALEVGAMNSLTVNLHMLMAAFYRPTDGRAAIIIEAGAFPSDRYAVGSQIIHHGRDPSEWLIEVQPRADGLLHTEDILEAVRANESRLALVLLGGVNYLTGQLLDLPAISAHMQALNAARSAKGQPIIPFGLDLAHAVGNVPLALHDWQVDFAAWCTYKYLNSGAGCLSGIFVHAKHADDGDKFPRLSGWWGVPFARRFKMAHKYEEAKGAAGFGVSNVNMLMAACVKASLLVFRKAGGIMALRRKSILLTAYMERLIQCRGLQITIQTPADPTRRGCQLSLRVTGSGTLTMRALEEALRARGVVGDAREPDIVRLSPAPLYNNFTDVRRAIDALELCLQHKDL